MLWADAPRVGARAVSSPPIPAITVASRHHPPSSPPAGEHARIHSKAGAAQGQAGRRGSGSTQGQAGAMQGSAAACCDGSRSLQAILRDHDDRDDGVTVGSGEGRMKMTMKVPEMSCKCPVHPACPPPERRASSPPPFACFPSGLARCLTACHAATGGHCKGVIEKEVAKIEGVATVSADPTSKDVVVSSLSALRAGRGRGGRARRELPICPPCQTSSNARSVSGAMREH